MIKIAENNAVKFGPRSLGVVIPAIWRQDNKAEAGDKLEVYRGEVPGVGVDCIIIKKAVQPLTDKK